MNRILEREREQIELDAKRFRALMLCADNKEAAAKIPIHAWMPAGEPNAVEAAAIVDQIIAALEAAGYDI